MKAIAAWIIIVYVAWWFYKIGKRTGSRKGYNVGRCRRNRNRR